MLGTPCDSTSLQHEMGRFVRPVAFERILNRELVRSWMLMYLQLQSCPHGADTCRSILLVLAAFSLP
eukprot:3800848-Amphidinium_carterae.1